MAATIPTVPGMGGITVIDIPSTGPTYTTVYTDLCSYYWHPGVYLKIDNPKNNVANINSFGEGCLLTTNRAIRSTVPSGGSNGWLTNGTSGSVDSSLYQYYKTRKSNQTDAQATTFTTPILDATGYVGNRQPTYPENDYLVINRYAATSCTSTATAQINKYKKSFAFNQAIKGNYFNQSTWVKYCHDYEMTTYTDVSVSYYDSQTEALTIRRVKNRIPTPTQTVLTVVTDPESATVQFTTSGIVLGKSIMVARNTRVDFTVSLDHYETESRSVVVTESTTETVVLNPEVILCTLTITPGPENATVSFNDTPGTVINNSIAVETGTTVHYTVSSPGYITQDDYYVVTENKNLRIILEAESIQPETYTLTIVPSPADSIVTFNTQGVVENNSITVAYGTIVDYTVSHDGYITQELSTTVNSDLSVNVTLQTSVLAYSTLTINPTPDNATVTFSTGQVIDNSTVVATGTTVTYTVSKTGYITQSATITVVSDLTLDIELQEILYILTVNTVPDTAIVTFQTSGNVSGNTISVTQGTQVFYTVSASGYVTQTGSTIVDQTKEVTVTLDVATYYVITINPTPGNATVSFNDTPGTISGNTITVLEGTTVSYTVSASGYIAINDTTMADGTKTINVTLTESLITLTISTTPANAVVTFNTQGTVSGKSITVQQNTNVSFSVTCEDYADYTDTVVADYSRTIDIIMTYQPYDEGEVIFESSTSGTHTATLLVGGRFQLVAVGGGAGAANGFKYGPQQQGYFNGSAGGGSGGYSTNISNISAGSLTVVVGSLGTTVIASQEGEVTGTNGSNTTIGNLIIAYGGTAGYVDMTANPMTATAGTGGVGITTSGLDGGSYKNTLRTVMYRQAPVSGGESVYLTYGKGSGITYDSNHNNLPNPGTAGYAKIVYLGASNPESVTISVSPTPNYASVTFLTEGTITGGSITVLYGTVVTYTVSATGYYDKTQSLTAVEDRTIEVVLDARPPQYTLTILPGPETADVTFETEGIISGNSITVEAGTEVFYTVSATGYITQSSSIVLNATQNLSVILEAEQIITPDPILTVSPTPNTATVTFNTSGTVSGNTIAVPVGTTVSYTVTATGYSTLNDVYTVTQDETIYPVLQPIPVILTVNTSPSDATVTFITSGTVSGNSITVNQGTTVEYSVSRLGYVTKTETYTVTTTQQILVTLVPIYVYLTVTPTPSDATVTFNTSGTVSGNTITVVQYTDVYYTIERTGYQTLTNHAVIELTQTITETLTPNNYTLIVSPTYSNATVTFNTSGSISNNSITVPYNTVVSYTLTAAKHDTRTLSETVTSNRTVYPQMQLTLVNPTVQGTAAVTNVILDGGQAITAGHYQISRGGGRYTYDFDVVTDNRGVVTAINNITHVGDISTTSPHEVVPTGGWIRLVVWE